MEASHPILISLGSYCRNRFQIKRYLGALNLVDPGPYPFDMMVTPFDALRRMLAPDFDPATILCPGTTRIGPWGKVFCESSGLVFFHGFPAQTVETIYGAQVPDRLDHRFTEAPDCTRIREQAIARVGRLTAALQHPTRPKLLLRWLRSDATPEFPDLHAGETPEALHRLFTRNLSGGPVRTVLLTTRYLQEDEPPDPVIEDQRWHGPDLVSLRLVERRSGTPGFEPWQGENAAWTAMLDSVIDGIGGREWR